MSPQFSGDGFTLKTALQLVHLLTQFLAFYDHMVMFSQRTAIAISADRYGKLGFNYFDF